MDFELALVRSGEVPAEQYVEALILQQEERLPLGQIALETGVLSVRQVREILQAQGDTQERFGEVALAKGYIDRRDLAELLMVQNERQRPILKHLVELGALSKEQARMAMIAHKAGAQIGGGTTSSSLQRTLSSEQATEKTSQPKPAEPKVYAPELAANAS